MRFEPPVQDTRSNPPKGLVERTLFQATRLILYVTVAACLMYLALTPPGVSS
jgi:hypothetical protein